MRSIILLAVIFSSLPLSLEAADKSPPAFEGKNQIIKLSDRGAAPLPLRMTVDDSILFFYNETKDALVTLEMDYGPHHTHCASGNLRVGDDNKVRSVKPISPGDFASVCFHDKGTYPVTVYGLKANPKGIRGEIIVD